MKRNLDIWLNERRLKTHKSSRDEISKLFKIVDRDIAALQLSTIVLRASGYRTAHDKGGHHWMSIRALSELMGNIGEEFGDYFNACRIKRNTSDYTSCGEISNEEANELLDEVKKFKIVVVNWIRKNHPNLNYK